MKYFKRLIILLLFFTVGILHAQDQCNVSLASILGNYEGGCKKGKADGEGKAVGTDSYSGTFKEGLPNGSGRYEWKDGDIYQGDWVKGKMEGQGSKTYKRNGKTDSIVKGFWKKGLYLGRYEKPHVVHSQTNQIAPIDVRRISNELSNSITLELSNTSGGIPSLGSSASGIKASLTDLVLMSGAYLRIVNMTDSPKGTTLKIMDVEFPFKARYKIGTQEMVIEILEPGDWLINAFLNN